MSERSNFGTEQPLIGFSSLNLDGHALHNLQTVAFKTCDFSRVVRQQAESIESEMEQDLSERGRSLEEATLEEMEEGWNRAKERL